MGFLKKMFKNKEQGYNTSLSDTKTSEYPSFCASAASDDSVFSEFRVNEIYMQILEHVDSSLGKKYLDVILQTKLFSEDNFKLFQQNDWVGGASIRYYKEVGYICPSTLRYIKVLSDLMGHFGDLNGKDICEIGIGYGGQARIIMSMFKPKSYTFVDLEPVLLLAKKYLLHFDISTKLSFLCMEDLQKNNYDLFISNYAFSELRTSIQDIYIDKIVKNCSHGYITFNSIAPQGFNYPLEKYAEILDKNIKILDEIPCSHPLNKILIW